MRDLKMIGIFKFTNTNLNQTKVMCQIKS